jgi:cadmium resistance protein CadD (predicted permease)
VAEIFQTIGVAAALFTATNVDDIFLLVAFFADPRYRPRQVVIGQYLGIGALTAVSLVSSMIALVAAGESIGLLGLVPVGLGSWQLIQRWRSRPDHEQHDVATSSRTGILSVALVTFANGGDEIGAYVPVFATRSAFQLVVTVAVFFAMTAPWCLAGHWLVKHPKLGPRLRRIAEPATPFVLIAIGVLIIVESRAYRFVL